MNKNPQAGATLLELVAVFAVIAVALTVTAVASLTQLSRAEMRGTAYDVYAFMQLARVEAVTRNVECRFFIDAASRKMAIVDTRGTSTLSDDEVLHSTSLPDTVSLARPDTGGAVTLQHVSGTLYVTRFQQDGVVAAGTGSIHLFGGEEFRRVSVLGAGGVEVAQWDGSAWKIGS